MKPISYEQETGDKEKLCAQEPHRVLLGSMMMTGQSPLLNTGKESMAGCVV